MREFAPWNLSKSGSTVAVSLGRVDQVHALDSDGDTGLDLLVANETTIVWLENDGTGSFETEHAITGPAENQRLVGLDGDQDLVLLRTGGGQWYAKLDGEGNANLVFGTVLDEPLHWYRQVAPDDPAVGPGLWLLGLRPPTTGTAWVVKPHRRKSPHWVHAGER